MVKTRHKKKAPMSVGAMSAPKVRAFSKEEPQGIKKKKLKM